jgi:hypothetical protein
MSGWWVPATARGTAINVDEWGRPLYVFTTDTPQPDVGAIPAAALSGSSTAPLDRDTAQTSDARSDDREVPPRVNVDAATPLTAPLDRDRLREFAEDVARQFGYWSDGIGGVGTGGLSTLEEAFAILGWDDPHPLPDRRCDEPGGCMKDGTMGWPSPSGYRRTCWDHSDIGKARAAASPDPAP